MNITTYPEYNGDSVEFTVISTTFLEILAGVAVATRTSEQNKQKAVLWILSHTPSRTSNSSESRHSNAFPFRAWYTSITADLGGQDEELRRLTILAFAVLFMHEKCRQEQNVTATDLTFVWSLIHNALTTSLLDQPLYTASRSAQGFLAIPLCSLLKDGNIDEIFRLHVWLPDGQRGRPEFAIHSHQPFSQSWILAGEGKDYSYEVKPAANSAIATHAEYALVWKDEKNTSTIYKTHQTSSTVVNTGRLVRAIPTSSAIHTRDANYFIPKAMFH